MFGCPYFRNRRRKEAYFSDIEPQEIFLDKLAKKKEEEMGVSEKRLEVPLSYGVFRLFMFSVAFLFLVLFVRSFHLQVIEGSHFSSLAERNRSAVFSIQSLRGVIYDANMNQMVHNSPRFDLHLKKSELDNQNKAKVVSEVAEILGIEMKSLVEKIESSDSDLVIVEEDLEHMKLVFLQARIDNLTGFSIYRSLDRHYGDGTTFSHILGYIGKVDEETIRNNPGKYSVNDYVGIGGIERFYEPILTRKKGEIAVERDVSGEVKSQEIISLPEAGSNLILWIDTDLQKKIEEETVKILEEVGAKKAAVIAVDPKSGGVLSMVSIPSYDNNIFNKKDNQDTLSDLFSNTDGVFLNRAISATYPSGSAIKPLLAAAALEEGVINADKEIHSPGYITVPNPWNPSQPTIFRDNQAHGWTDLKKAIAVSSNVYFYSIGGGYKNQEGLGMERIKNYLELFGWGSVTGVDLPGEKNGFIPDISWKNEIIGQPWNIGDTYNASIGQGYLSVTPIQVVMAYSSLVNGGKVLVPRLLKEIRDDKGDLIERYLPEVIREGFIKENNLKEVKEGMYQTTTIGTARSLGTLPVKVGAKTGTAQISKQGYYHNWITVFAPFEDPEIVMTVIVEEVEGIRPTTIPIARSVLEWYFSEDRILEDKN